MMNFFKSSPDSRMFKHQLRKNLLYVSLSIVVVFSSVFYLLVQFLGSNIVASQNQTNNQIINHQLSKQLDAYESYILNFQELLAPLMKDIDTHRYQLNESLYGFINQQTIRGMFRLISNEGETLLTSDVMMPSHHADDIFLLGIYRQIHQRPDQLVVQKNPLQFNHDARSTISLGRGLIHEDERLGYLVFYLFDHDINSVVKPNSTDIVVITDRLQNTMFSTDTTILNNIGKFTPLIGQDNFTYSIRDQKHFILKSELAHHPLTIYTLTSHQFLDSLFLAGLISQILIVLVSIIAIIRVADYFANKNTQSLDQLLLAIDKVRHGDFSTKLNIDSYHEFAIVSTYFNEMIDNFVLLIKQNNELYAQNNVSEIRQLEAQFNPHFLFNALESLKYLIRFQSNDAENFVMKLAKILRYSISTSEQFVTLDNDLKHIQDYLDIQKIRYNQRLSYTFDIDAQCHQALIPKLMIQPLIENCIQHGYKQEPMMIKIIALAQNDTLHLMIEDNGNGILPEKLNKLQENLHSEANQTQHIGLYNVHRRLVLQYGKHYGLSINSLLGKKTTVTLRLPLTFKGDVTYD